MTLEDFLVEARVVREPCEVGVSSSSQNQSQVQQQPYSMYQNNNPNVEPSFVNRPIMGTSAGSGGGGAGGTTSDVPSYQQVPQGGFVIVESSGFVGNGKRNGVYLPQQAPPAVCYGGRVVSGGSAYAAPQTLGLAAPLSLVSPDAICTSQVDNVTGQFGLDMGGLRGRKQIIECPLEKVVERRQRRMIKNRESSTRSRARKQVLQAYTVELEAELNQLREEIAHLSRHW